jgi:cellulose synthase/poly-beta-1,6-N-acetylglucosamine synthase-like glycosyltransferase
MLWMLIRWLRIDTYTTPTPTPDLPATFISVIVVARNEEENIVHLLQDIENQRYATGQYEVIIVDDHSSDRTVEVVEAFAIEASFRVRILKLADLVQQPLPDGNYKKTGIEWGVREAQGELIVTTDGDCRVGKNWLQTYGTFYASSGAKFISGPVTFFDEKSVFEKMQTVEFASLIGSGAATLAMGIPTMCNGANLAYEKAVFEEVSGYNGVSGTASGDDLFLLHKVYTKYADKVFFLKSQEAIVSTHAKATIQEFYWQRKRWAGKWNLYKDKRVTLLAVFVFVCNASLTASLVALTCGFLPLNLFFAGLGLRFGVEFIMLASVLTFLQKPQASWWIIPLQAFYFLYVTFFGLVAQKKGYVWKERNLQ